MELTSMYGNEALQISAIRKWRTHFLQGRTELGDYPRSGRPANSGLAQLIAELIQECPFLSCKILYKHVRISKEKCLIFLHEKLGLKSFILDGFHASPPPTYQESLKGCHITSTSWNVPALLGNRLCEFLDWGRVVVLCGVSPF
jgi:hypothetical protein